MSFKDYYLVERVNDPKKIQKCEKIVKDWLTRFAIRIKKRVNDEHVEIPPKLCGHSVIFSTGGNYSKNAELTNEAVIIYEKESAEIYNDFLNALQLHEKSGKFLSNVKTQRDILLNHLENSQTLGNLLFHEMIHWTDRGYIDLSQGAANAKFEKDKIQLTKSLMGWPVKKSSIAKKEVETYLKDVGTSKISTELNSAHELNAYFLTAFKNIKDEDFDSFDEMKTKFIWAYGPNNWKMLTDENKRRQLKRLYTTMDNFREQEESI